MTAAQAGYDKSREHQREFDTLPNVLVQDPIRTCAYYVRSTDLVRFTATSDTWARLDDTTVTFTIPDGEIVDEVPPALRAPELQPSVLIRYTRGKRAFFLTFEDLQQFRIDQPTEALDLGSISFIIPRGTELVEELPLIRRALLQSNTQ